MDIAYIIGRFIAGIYFLESAYNHFANVGSLAGYAQSKGVPQPKLAVLGSGALLALGGLSLLLGMYMEIGIVLLLVFLIVVSLMMHAFWKIDDASTRAMERIQFMKNMGLIGLLLIILGLISL